MNSSKGFTIIELIISIFILTSVVVGIFNVFSIMTILTSNTTDSLTATYLAQEGMEIIRNIRDTNWLKMDANPGSANWGDGFSHCEDGQGCEVDYITTGSGYSPKPYSSGHYLNIDSNGFYSYSNGTNTKFKRKITISQIKDVDNKSDHVLKVITQVSWDEKATLLNSGLSADNCVEGNNCIIVEGILYDWYNYVNQ